MYTTCLDHDGIEIDTGDLVKLQGIVASIDLNNPHYRQVRVFLSYPAPYQLPYGGVSNASIRPIHGGGFLSYPGGDIVIAVPGLCLTH